MQVVGKGILQVDHLRASYPYQVQPGLSLPDYMLNMAAGNCVDNQNMTIDTLSGCSYTKARFVPQNQRAAAISGGATGGLVADNDQYVDANLPNWTWDTITCGGANTKVQAFQGNDHGNQVLSCVWDSDTPPTTATFEAVKDNVDPHGFLAFIDRTIYNKPPAGTDCYWEVRWQINQSLFRVKVSQSEYSKLEVTTDLTGASGWKTVVAQIKTGGSLAELLGSTSQASTKRPIIMGVRLMNKTLAVRFGSETTPVQVPIDSPGNPPVITKVWVLAGVFNEFGCDLHRDKWHTHGQIRSNPQDWGFSPANTPYYLINGTSTQIRRASGVFWSPGYPAGSKITVTRVGATTDVTTQYDLAIDNTAAGQYAGQDYADHTALVTRVTSKVDPIFQSFPSAPRAIIPKDILLQLTFNPNSMSVGVNFVATLDNFHGQWAGQSADIAVGLSLGLANPSTAYFQQFTGMCERYEFSKPAANRATMALVGKGLMRFLQVPNFSPPVMDFWNHYYAISELAQLGGFTPSQMAFSALVPSDPYSAAPGDPNPYFLPAGFGGRPWTPRGTENIIQGLMDYIRRPTGYLLYVDAFGYLRYEKWIPPSLVAPKAHYTPSPTGFDGSNLSEYWNFRLVRDNSELRNQLLLIGIDPYDPRWSLIITRLEDTASIYAAPGFEPLNYKGYKDPFVWSDSRFANRAFAVQAALNIFEIIRLPGIDVSFDCWLQPNLYPMDVIYVDDPFSGATGIPFYVMSVTHRYGYQGAKLAVTTSVQGKFLR
jgi:hypothetical protein